MVFVRKYCRANSMFRFIVLFVSIPGIEVFRMRILWMKVHFSFGKINSDLGITLPMFWILDYSSQNCCDFTSHHQLQRKRICMRNWNIPYQQSTNMLRCTPLKQIIQNCHNFLLDVLFALSCFAIEVSYN